MQVRLPGDRFAVPAQDRVPGEGGREFAQSVTANGMRLQRRQSTLVIFEQQSLLSELPEQFFDLSVLEHLICC